MSVTPEEMKLVTSRLDLLENKQQDLAIAHDNLEIKVSKKFVNLDRKDQVEVECSRNF